MFVCLCNGYREAELRELARQGVTCAVQAYAALGNEPNCGSCMDIAQRIIDESQAGPRVIAAAAD